MMNLKNIALMVLLLATLAAPFFLNSADDSLASSVVPADREEVVFWHFWGGRDREVVQDVVERFNESQNRFFVREIAMPGNNLQSKLFLATTGGDPPDLINQDDPVLADWAARGIIQPLSDVADPVEVQKVRDWMFDSAERLSVYDDQLFAVCNGLDIRALYYNETALEHFGCEVPTTIAELNAAAETISPAGQDSDRKYFGYLPDSRRLWAWGYVFGGQFVGDDGDLSLDSQNVVAASRWMKGFSDRYGPENIAAFRTADQSLPGKTFPLLPIESDRTIGRYVMLMDGQWRVRDIEAFNRQRIESGAKPIRFGVAPLPCPADGRKDAGWVNGNFFMIPTNAKCSEGAWEFMKFWIGYNDPAAAAKTCIAGGWIPVSEAVVVDTGFVEYLDQSPLFARFVELAQSPNQFPVPIVMAGAQLKRGVESASYKIMFESDSDPRSILSEAQQSIAVAIEEARESVRHRAHRTPRAKTAGAKAGKQ